MTELFQNVLEASFHGGVVIAVVLLARQVLKKVPKKYICLLWLLAALRLLMPFEIESGFSLQPELDTVKVPGSEYAERVTTGFDSGVGEVSTPSVTVPDTVEKPVQDVTVSIEQNAIIYEREVPLKVLLLENYELILSWVWLVVAIGMLGYSVVSYLRLRRRVRDAVILSEGVWVSGRVESPFVMGFIRPRIYLNPGLSEMEREYVLAHEDCHIRRLDHWWKWLGYITLAVHWFNPLVWVGYVLLCRDLEMACDEAVVKEMTVGERKAYSAALLACSARGHTIAACPVAFGEVSVKGRIQNVLNYRKPRFWFTLAAVVAVVVIAVCFLTSPVKDNLLELSGVSTGEITGISLRDLVGSAGISGEKELTEVVKVLKEVRYDPDTIVYPSPVENGMDMENEIRIFCGEETVIIHFAENLGYVYVNQNEVYSMTDPGALQALFEEKLNAVTGRHASGEPFATADDVAAWVSGIQLDAVESVEYYRTTKHEEGGGASSRSGNLRESSFRELLEALNALPPDAFAEKNTLLGRSMDELSVSDLQSGRALAKELTTVTIQDGINGLVAVLRYYVDNSGEEFLELAITNDLEAFESYTGNLKNLRCWSVESEALCDVMRDFAEYAPIVQYFGGVQKAHWGIVATGKNASATGIQFCFVQSDPNIQGDLFYGQAYTLIRYDEVKREWVAVEPIVDNGSFTAEAILLPKDTTTVVDIDWEWLYGSLPDGTYCISKDVWLDQESHTFDVYFGVEDGYEASDSDPTEGLDIAGKTFTYEKDGIGGKFNITINADGTFTYYEGLASSYIGLGNWALDGDTLILFDEGMVDKIRYYYFKVTEDALIFQAEKSHNFTYMDVADGDRFYVSGEVQQMLTNEAVVNMCAAAYTELYNADRYWLLACTPSDPYPLGIYQYVDGENYFIDALTQRGYNTLKYNGTVYFYVQQDYMEDKSIPTGWMTDSWVREHYGVALDGTRETFPWEVRDWDALGLELERWEEQDGGLTLEFTEKADPDHLWSFKLDGKGDLESITSSPDGKMEAQWTIRGINGAYIDVIPLWYAEACRSVPDAVIVRDQAFYEELFTRQTDGHFTTDWIGHLFEAFYAEPEEFARQLSRKFSEDPDQIREVLTCMSYEVEWYEPERFAQTLADLRNVAGLDQGILDLMAEYLLKE